MVDKVTDLNIGMSWHGTLHIECGTWHMHMTCCMACFGHRVVQLSTGHITVQPRQREYAKFLLDHNSPPPAASIVLLVSGSDLRKVSCQLSYPSIYHFK